MKKSKLSIVISATCVLLMAGLASCDKEHGHQAPVVSISSPANHEQFSGAATVHVIATATHEDALHEMKLEVRQDGTDSLIFACYPSVHELMSFTLDTTFTAPVVSTETELHIEAEAVDHEGQSTSSEVHVHIMP